MQELIGLFCVLFVWINFFGIAEECFCMKSWDKFWGGFELAIQVKFICSSERVSIRLVSFEYCGDNWWENFLLREEIWGFHVAPFLIYQFFTLADRPQCKSKENRCKTPYNISILNLQNPPIKKSLTEKWKIAFFINFYFAKQEFFFSLLDLSCNL